MLAQLSNMTECVHSAKRTESTVDGHKLELPKILTDTGSNLKD